MLIKVLLIKTVVVLIDKINNMISVIVADDHAVVRTGLQLIFMGTDNICVKEEAGDGAELLLKLKKAEYDVLILDVNMPGVDSIDLFNHIKSDYTDLPVVVFSMNRDEKLASRMLKNGAMAYINKEEDPRELIEAVNSAVNGKKYLTQSQKYFFANQFISGEQEKGDYESLTDREYQVLYLLASGNTKTEISEKLSISKNTLSNHRNNILKKLNLANNVELTKYALSHQIVQ